jgi:DNA-binding transcriptional LysR family regulator
MPKSETLRVFSPLAVCCHQLAPLMPEFNERYPDLRVELVTGRGPIGNLDSTIDVAIYPSDLKDSSLIARKIADCGWVVCASPAYLAKHGTPQQPTDLLEHNCLNFTMDVPCNTWRVSDGNAILPLFVKGTTTATDAETLLALAKAGTGIVRILEYVAGRDIQDGHLVPLFPDHRAGPRQPIYAVYQTRRHLAPRVRVFLDFLEEALRRQSWSSFRRPAEPTPLRQVA